VVTSSAELLDALAQGRREIEVRETLSGMPMITLPPGVRLRGGTLRFGAKGVRLTRDNELTGVTVRTAESEVAIFNDTSVDDLGTLSLRDVRTVGQVLFVAEHAVRSGHVRVQGLRVLSADVRGRVERPYLVGVEALQGAVTVWNRQPDPSVTITAELLDVGAGTAEAPVRGSGVLVGGQRGGGTLRVPTLSTGEIHVDGGIAPGTPDLIGAGVMVVDRVDVRAPIQTFGTGARGFNFYAGTLRHASFHSIATHGDGSIGIQVGEELPVLEIITARDGEPLVQESPSDDS
jgi:hypothetical protein